MLSEDASFTGASWVAYATSKNFTLSAGDGVKTVYVKYKDSSANESASYNDTITLDTVGPNLTQFVINDNDVATNNLSSTLTIGGLDGTTAIDDMMLSEASDFTGASWEAYATTKAFTLSSGEGTKTVYLKFRDVANNVSSVFSDTISVDLTKPTINITDLGLIDNVPDKTPLFYYFTSQTPHIQGKTEANSTVHFVYDGDDTTATANGSGFYEIDLPELPRQYVEIEYYAVDPAGNQSSTRLLKLIIGVENFPVTSVTNVTGSPEGGTTSPTPSVTPPNGETPTETPVVYAVLITDANGATLSNNVVYINEQKYVSDASGLIYIEKQLSADMQVEVEVNGKRVKGNILGEKIIAEEVAKSKPTLLLVLGGISLLGVLGIVLKKVLAKT